MLMLQYCVDLSTQGHYMVPSYFRKYILPRFKTAVNKDDLCLLYVVYNMI